MFKPFKFVKDFNFRWFAEIPEWEGSRDELEMVMGADWMLDLLSNGEDSIELYLSDEPFDGYSYKLNFKEEIYEGATYLFNGNNIDNYSVWLCGVTKFVFGKFPQTIFLAKKYKY
jgi:hypothetical protein